MNHTVAQTVARFKRNSQKYRRQIKADPELAKETLIQAGILVRSKTSPSGIKLAKVYRSVK